MKNTSGKKPLFLNLIIAAIIGCLSLQVSAQSRNDEDDVKKCLENYMSGEGTRVEKAFHPSATMKYIDNKSGEFKDVPIADYIARVKANAPATDRKIAIAYKNIEGTAAQAEIRIETDKAILIDYMNLLKIDGEWKIVSKIFARKDK